MIIHITSVEEFDQHLNNNKDKLLVVDFTASWCGPCRMIGPVFKDLSEDAANKNVVFLKVDVDEVPELTERYKVSAMPTFMFFKDGKVDTLVGANKDKLVKMITDMRA